MAVFKIGMANELADKERFVSPILFALLFVLLLWFAFGELPETMGIRIYVAESFLALFFALQLSFARIYEPELEDNALTLYRTIPIHPIALFLGKFLQVFLSSAMITLATAAVGALFLGNSISNPFNGPFLIVLLFALIGLCGIGVLLSALTAQIQAKQVLFPLLFFPLTVPVMIIGVQCCIFVLDGSKTLDQLWGSWLGLLIVFDLVYCTVGILFFDELMKSN